MEADVRYLEPLWLLMLLRRRKKSPEVLLPPGCAPPRRAQVDPLRWPLLSTGEGHLREKCNQHRVARWCTEVSVCVRRRKRRLRCKTERKRSDTAAALARGLAGRLILSNAPFQFPRDWQRIKPARRFFGTYNTCPQQFQWGLSIK